MIRTDYDPEADVLHVRFGPEGAKYDGAEEVAPGVFVEFDPNGNPIGIEITSVRRREGAETFAGSAPASVGIHLMEAGEEG